MRTLDQQEFTRLIEQTAIKPRLKKELRFIKSTQHMSRDDWEQSELVAITDRSGQKGILLIAPDEELFIMPYEISQGLTSRTGQAQPIICDFCRTWQSGTRSGSISFPRDRTFNTISFLCCADLRCSDHVRGRTSAARASRAQLREDLTPEQRVERLRLRLRELVTKLALSPAQNA